MVALTCYGAGGESGTLAAVGPGRKGRAGGGAHGRLLDKSLFVPEPREPRLFRGFLPSDDPICYSMKTASVQVLPEGGHGRGSRGLLSRLRISPSPWNLATPAHLCTIPSVLLPGMEAGELRCGVSPSFFLSVRWRGPTCTWKAMGVLWEGTEVYKQGSLQWIFLAPLHPRERKHRRWQSFGFLVKFLLFLLLSRSTVQRLA